VRYQSRALQEKNAGDGDAGSTRGRCAPPRVSVRTFQAVVVVCARSGKGGFGGGSHGARRRSPAQWAGHSPSPVAESVFRNSNNGLGRLPFAPAPFPSLQEQSKIHCLAHLDAARVVPGTSICDRTGPVVSHFFLSGSPRGARDASGEAPATQIEMAQVAGHSPSLPRHGMAASESPCSACTIQQEHGL
jgi:hypothetical protein